VLASADRPTVEISFEVSGDFAGVGTTWLGTYWAAVRPDGTLYGECPQQGLIMTDDGGVGSWTSAGVGWFGEAGATDFRGALYLMSAPEKLAHLTRTAIVFEWHVDGEGAARGTFWAWT
jgi:hypothetical protein